jgi:hypothetical protein
VAVVEITLIKKIQEALQGVSFGSTGLDVYVRGHIEEDANAPFVLIERPETDGRETLDRRTHNRVTLQIRCHDSKAAKGFYSLRSLSMSSLVVDTLKTSTVEVEGKDITFVEPDKNTVTYDMQGTLGQAGDTAYDTILTYEIYP